MARIKTKPIARMSTSSTTSQPPPTSTSPPVVSMAAQPGAGPAAATPVTAKTSGYRPGMPIVSQVTSYQPVTSPVAVPVNSTAPAQPHPVPTPPMGVLQVSAAGPVPGTYVTTSNVQLHNASSYNNGQMQIYVGHYKHCC